MTGQKQVSTHQALRAVVADCFEPRAVTYWVDLLLSATVGWCAFAVASTADAWIAAIGFLVSALSLYRCVVFTHELVHLKKGSFKIFRAVWDVICGIPLMVPSFLYDGVHQEHHFRGHYGTPGDGEYLPFARAGRRLILVYLLGHIVIPLLGLLRFALIAPIAWCIPALRQLRWSRLSSLSIDPRYVRKVPDRVPLSWRIQEAATAVFAWLLVGLTVSGSLPARVIIVWYLVAVTILTLNGVRTLVAHRYRNLEGTLSFDEQLLDSINLAGSSWLTPLIAPVGLRYHALHHLFPTMPYHRLGTAHRRLVDILPEDAPYLRTIETGVTPALCKLWRGAAGSA